MIKQKKSKTIGKLDTIQRMGRKFNNFANAMPANTNGKAAATKYPVEFFKTVDEENQLHVISNASNTWT